MVVVGYEEIHLWCMTQDEVVWRKLDLRPQELEAIVGTLRASLDIEPEDKAGDLTKRPLFDLGLAHELYTKLLGEVSPVITSKSRLLVVPSGPLTSLPLHLLVSSKPAGSEANPPAGNSVSRYRMAGETFRHFRTPFCREFRGVAPQSQADCGSKTHDRICQPFAEFPVLCLLKQDRRSLPRNVDMSDMPRYDAGCRELGQADRQP